MFTPPTKNSATILSHFCKWRKPNPAGRELNVPRHFSSCGAIQSRVQAQMREHFRRRTVKLCQRDVPDIPDVFKTLRRSIKATGSEIPEFGEKAGSALEFRLRVGNVANVVANGSLLFLRQSGKVFLKSFFGFQVEPNQSVEDLFSIRRPAFATLTRRPASCGMRKRAWLFWRPAVAG